MRRPLLSLICVTWLTVLGPDARAQVEPDSVEIGRPDSLAIEVADSLASDFLRANSRLPDSLLTDSLLTDSLQTSASEPPAPIRYPFDHAPTQPGAVVDSVKPADGYYLDVTSSLALTRGGFTHGMGNLGWPDQWSFLAMPPGFTELTIDGISVRDPVTHRSLFDVLPVDAVTRFRVTGLGHGNPVLLHGRIRPLDEVRPYTELRYENGTFGLQSISALHVQQRQWRIFGAPTVTQFVARFAFHEWTGGYPNSRSDLSQVLARIGFTSRRWRIRFTNSYSLRTRGAHSGVNQKAGRGFDSVYERFDATVGDPSAEQRLQRNQFDVAVEHTWTTGLKPLSVTTSFVNSLYRYTNIDAPESKSDEFRLVVQQAAPELIRDHEFTGRLTFESVDISSDGLLTGGGGASKSRFLVSADDLFHVGRVMTRVMVGLQTVDGWSYPSGGLEMSTTLGGMLLSAEGGFNGRAPSPLERYGGLGVDGADDAVDGLSVTETRNLRLAVAHRGDAVSAEFVGFANHLIDPTDILSLGADAYAVAQAEGSVTWIGLSATLGWRTTARRGFYLSVSPTVQTATVSGGADPPITDVTDETGTTRDPILDGLASSLPGLYGSARFGFRGRYFVGDLDLDVYLLGRFWSEFQGRAYNPVHALSVLSEPDSRPVTGSGTVDVRIEAGIREADLYVSVDNVLAGLLYSGAMVVPVYPLPDIAFRFGVMWPIWN